MRPDEIREKAETRATPLPEERAVERGDEDRRVEAAAILRDSEDRVTSAAEAPAPADAAHEHRRSEDTAPPAGEATRRG
jgi:hypothetical protein